jgi:nucleotide sugar dehydrogenase
MIHKWASAEDFMSRIDQREVQLCVVGLGYVGLPLALSFAEKGFTTYGFDADTDKISKLRNGRNYLLGEEWLDHLIERYVGKTFIPEESIVPYDIAFIDVPTPYDEAREKPAYDYVISAAKSIGRAMEKGSLIILESTVGPGTTKGLLREILESESLLKAGEDFGLVFSPERINPGDAEHRIYNTPKVVAGYDRLSTDIAAHLYEQILPQIFKLYDPTEGEMAKLFENIQRDANIALTNEMAQICDYLRVDIMNVIEAASTKWCFYRFVPSCGVGGHCLPEDPYFLLDEVPVSQHSIIKDAREINNSMPGYTVEKVLSWIKQRNKDPQKSKVSLLGLSYKKNIGDTRSSPSKAIVEQLRKEGIEPIVYDPYIKGVSWATTGSLEDVLKSADAIILCTDHDKFYNLPEKANRLAPGSLFLDGKNMFNPEDFNGIEYRGIGRQ